MASDHDTIFATLERLAQAHGDPADVIYARLFERHPEFERLFILDAQGAARGNMLAYAFEVLLDIAGPRRFAASFMLAERINHEGIGVSGAAYAHFFEIMFESVRDLLAREWTPEADAAWRRALAEIEAVLSGAQN
ncbi:MAG: globin [Hyphomonadaceae bacterium]